ncbi:MAG: uracil-DNA glycosylase [Chlamydiales bacterium]|nr:uracil-DNA glycosylase [Chlamydiales bacterium]
MVDFMKLEKSWHQRLEEETKQPYIVSLKEFLEADKKNGTIIYPRDEDIFKAFLYTPYQDVKVVIVGQDPYHGPNQAHGLCFSVPKEEKVPPSLKNIYKELESDLGVKPVNHGNLVKWARQGVLLLNATLTVRAGSPKSHYGKGWELFTDKVIRLLADREDPVIFVLWGASAKEKCEHVLTPEDHKKHFILTAAHPSPFSAHLFFGCHHFSKINQKLKEWGKSPIDWNLNEQEK